MRNTVRCLVSALLGACLSLSAHAGADARVTLNGRVLELASTGFAFTSPAEIPNGFFGVTLQPFGTVDLVFDYAMRVADDGLATDAGASLADACAPISGRFCGPSAAGHEVAQALLLVAFRDGRVANRFIDVSSDVSTPILLRTQADAFADVLEQSGTIHVHIVNGSAFTQSDNFVSFMSVWVAAVPEPGAWAQCLAGLSVLGSLGWARSRGRR